ncbi:MAG: hypothetical protein NT004_17410 [Bacteroidetes bacterium]|nr:hypothetical protein [Bacteroidota bacterium]
MKAGADPVSEDSTSIDWHLIWERNWTFSEKAPFEIEPGESDSLYADFFVDKQVKIIQFYYYIANIEKEGKNLGWALTRYYQIPVTNRQKQNPMNRLSNNSSGNEQQKLQIQQRPQPKQSPAKPVNSQDQPREPIRAPEKKK